MKRALLAWALGLAIAPGVALVAAACGQSDVAVASYVDAGPPACGGDAGGCEPGFFCSKKPCGAVTGTCEEIPDAASCSDAGFLPVCGCDDNTTYFNDCLRQSAGQSAMIANVCANSKPNDNCALFGGCAPGALCLARVLGPDNQATVQGFELGIEQIATLFDASVPVCTVLNTVYPPFMCWRLPAECPGGAGVVQDLCATRACTTVDACDALRRGGLYGQWTCP